MCKLLSLSKLNIYDMGIQDFVEAFEILQWNMSELEELLEIEFEEMINYENA